MRVGISNVSHFFLLLQVAIGFSYRKCGSVSETSPTSLINENTQKIVSHGCWKQMDVGICLMYILLVYFMTIKIYIECMITDYSSIIEVWYSFSIISGLRFRWIVARRKSLPWIWIGFTFSAVEQYLNPEKRLSSILNLKGFITKWKNMYGKVR